MRQRRDLVRRRAMIDSGKMIFKLRMEKSEVKFFFFEKLPLLIIVYVGIIYFDKPYLSRHLCHQFLIHRLF